MARSPESLTEIIEQQHVWRKLKVRSRLLTRCAKRLTRGPKDQEGVISQAKDTFAFLPAKTFKWNIRSPVRAFTTGVEQQSHLEHLHYHRTTCPSAQRRRRSGLAYSPTTQDIASPPAVAIHEEAGNTRRFEFCSPGGTFRSPSPTTIPSLLPFVGTPGR